jgi:hypothetical protein
MTPAVIYRFRPVGKKNQTSTPQPMRFLTCSNFKYTIGNFTAVITGNFTGNTAGHFPLPGNSGFIAGQAVSRGASLPAGGPKKFQNRAQRSFFFFQVTPAQVIF